MTSERFTTHRTPYINWKTACNTHIKYLWASLFNAIIACVWYQRIISEKKTISIASLQQTQIPSKANRILFYMYITRRGFFFLVFSVAVLILFLFAFAFVPFLVGLFALVVYGVCNWCLSQATHSLTVVNERRRKRVFLLCYTFVCLLYSNFHSTE